MEVSRATTTPFLPCPVLVQAPHDILILLTVFLNNPRDTVHSATIWLHIGHNHDSQNGRYDAMDTLENELVDAVTSPK